MSSMLLLFSTPPLAAQDLLQGDFWKQQLMNDIIDPWTTHAQDHTHGAFHSHLGQQWQVTERTNKYPGMIARHLFSYAVAYHVSGEASCLQLADKTFAYMVRHGWDPSYGGWYHELDKNGRVLSEEKDMFMNAYAITGLAMYYIITRDTLVKDYLDRSIAVFEKAWDAENGGGYVSKLNRDLSLLQTDKVFSPQLAPVSGYLLYLYAATREPAYLQTSERILDTVLRHMKDAGSGWIMEGYGRDWKPLSAMNRKMNTGHNIEVAWMLMRLYALNGNKHYLQQAMALNDSLLQYAFDRQQGIWYHQLSVDNPRLHSEDSPWWVQAYGNMFQLFLHARLQQDAALENFRKGAAFWNQYFVDRKAGGSFLSVDRHGNILEGAKAVRTKTSYHAVEHGLLNMLYLDYWVHRKPVKVYYQIRNSAQQQLFPLLLEDSSYHIQEVLVNGKEWKAAEGQQGSILLPDKTDYTLSVQLQYLP